jgi:hypothetical protein
MKQTLSLALITALLVVASAYGQSIEVTRSGASAIQCLDPDGLVVSQHNTQHDAQESCSNEALKNPGANYRVRTSDVNIVGTAAPATEPPPEVSTFALTFDPDCPALVPLDVTLGTPFTTPPLRLCISGEQADTGQWELFSESGDDAYENGFRVSDQGVISNPATMAGMGQVVIRISIPTGTLSIPARNWRVAP